MVSSTVLPFSFVLLYDFYAYWFITQYLRGESVWRGQVVQYGRHRKRRNYARISEVLELPNLIEIQTKSYDWFLKEGLLEMFRDISPIEDFTGNLSLEFVDYRLGEPKYDLEESKTVTLLIFAPLRVKVRLIIKETGEVKEQEVFMGDFPLMTDTGTFVINGANV